MPPEHSKAERNYSQIDKEALAVVFAVKKFNQLKTFQNLHRSQTMLGLLSADKAVPPMASGRVRRWALTLSAYEYDLIHRPGKENGNADGLSRLPLPEEPKETPIPAEVVHLMETIHTSPITSAQIKQWLVIASYHELYGVKKALVNVATHCQTRQERIDFTLEL
ncbi:Transposon Tf2-8 polyprotein [Exaiptasia diaphana]|nr:Transposon Tf2-8 polyprotein [Exaiptasia diaphana]